jgi:hypothetical protein
LINLQDKRSFLSDFCEAFNISLVKNILGNYRINIPIASAYNFSSSGTGTPGNEDIFTDTDVLLSGIYSQHPILQRSLKLERSDASNVYGRVKLWYFTLGDDFIRYTLTGTNVTVEIFNPFIADSTSAAGLLAAIDQWLLNQKWMIRFTTFYNAIAHEIGDIINIRHSDLDDNILPWGSVNTQKWMIIRITHKWHPNTIEITAIELP